MAENRCVCCGESIPEGRMVCPSCSADANMCGISSTRALERNRIYNEDCLEGMKKIQAGSVDVIATDSPYGMDYQSARRTDKEKRHKKILNDKYPKGGERK